MDVREVSTAYQVPRNFKQTDIGLLPIDWTTAPLAREFEVQLGKMLDAEKNTGFEKPFIGNRAVQWGRIETIGVGLIKLAPSELSRFRLRKGDLLVCEGGEVGRCAIWNEPLPECYFQKALHRLRPKNGYDVDLLANVLRLYSTNGFLANYVTQTSIAHLPKDKFECIPIPLPPTRHEQRAIAEALSDADALIESLSLLLAKKRQIKQGAMQELLTGKKRLPGFGGEWKASPLGDIAHIKTGKRNNQDKVEDGAFPFFVRSAEVERLDSYSYDCEAILVPGEGGIGSIFHYIDGRFDVHQRVYAITEFAPGVLGKYVHLYMSQYFGPYAMQNSVKATVDSLRLPTFQSFSIRLPPTADEQAAIANVVGELEEQIAVMALRLAKVCDIKQGMMQALLVGRIRLVQPESNVIPLPLKPAAAHPPPPLPAHNWQINEAVVIGVLAQHFGDDKFPLPRKRRVKLMYLLHRHAEGRAEGYLKKAAGPYDPNTKYKGPEAIALKNGYVRALRNGTYEGFVAGDKAEQAQRYFEQWYGTAALDWLERFHYRKTEELELLATVDMAMVDLAAAGQPADVAGVKRVIAAHPEWVPKLSRELFSDENIARAAAECVTLFTAQ